MNDLSKMIALTAEEKKFLLSVQTKTLPLTAFNHLAHLQLAWCFLKGFPLPEAMLNFRDALKNYVTHFGKEDLYHETITFALMMILHERMQDSVLQQPSTPIGWNEFIKGQNDLIFHAKELLLRHYPSEILFSDRAKKYFIFPIVC